MQEHANKYINKAGSGPLNADVPTVQSANIHVVIMIIWKLAM